MGRLVGGSSFPSGTIASSLSSGHGGVTTRRARKTEGSIPEKVFANEARTPPILERYVSENSAGRNAKKMPTEGPAEEAAKSGGV